MRSQPEPDRTVVQSRADLGGGAATPSFRLPDGATNGLPAAPEPLRIGPATFIWGSRTYVMGILNVTPDSFSGDGLLNAAGTRLRGSDDAGAALLNDVWGVATDDALLRVVAERRVPIVLMHNRAEPRYVNVLAEVIADLHAAIERALTGGVPWESIVIDPGFGFGKTPEHNLALLRDLRALRILGRPILLGTSRKSTLGKVLDLPADQRVEATVATTALGIAAGVDIVRVHDVQANVRAARMTDAVVR